MRSVLTAFSSAPFQGSSSHLRPTSSCTALACWQGLGEDVELPRPRILVVEDVMLLAEMLCDTLLDSGFEPVGPAASVAVGMKIVKSSAIDAGILDIRIWEGVSFPIAYALREQRLPFMFLTALDRNCLPGDLADAPLVSKPFQPLHLLATLQDLLLSRFGPRAREA